MNGSNVLIVNNTLVCPSCETPMQVYGSVAPTEKQHLYAAECKNNDCALLLRFKVEIERMVRPSRILERQGGVSE